MTGAMDPNHGFLIKPRRETLFGPNSKKAPVPNHLNFKQCHSRLLQKPSHVIPAKPGPAKVEGPESRLFSCFWPPALAGVSFLSSFVRGSFIFSYQHQIEKGGDRHDGA